MGLISSPKLSSVMTLEDWTLETSAVLLLCQSVPCMEVGITVSSFDMSSFMDLLRSDASSFGFSPA